MSHPAAANSPSQVLVSALLVFALGGLPASGAENDVPRTAAGRPDLSGNYDISTLTPFERDPKYGDRLLLTAEEAREIQEGAASRSQAQSLPSDPDRSAPSVGGNVGGYNAFYLDLGTAAVSVDGKYRTSLLVDPPNGRMPPLTEHGKARREGLFNFWGKNSGEAWWLGEEPGPYDGPETLSIADRCIFHLEATVPARPRAYNNVKTIVQTESHVMILTEWMHEARIVRLAGEGAGKGAGQGRPSEHVPEEIRSHSGDSVGWWEGDTLIVETTNFLEEDWVTGTVGGNPSPAYDQRVVERFTRVAGGDLLYQFTVESGDFEVPYSGEYTWPATESQLYEYACHEGNYALGNILRGSRLLESESR